MKFDEKLLISVIEKKENISNITNIDFTTDFGEGDYVVFYFHNKEKKCAIIKINDYLNVRQDQREKKLKRILE